MLDQEHCSRIGSAKLMTMMKEDLEAKNVFPWRVTDVKLPIPRKNCQENLQRTEPARRQLPRHAIFHNLHRIVSQEIELYFDLVLGN